MNPKALLGAIGAGVLGAVVWAVIINLTGYEVGLIAWGIGGLVGFAAAALGGVGVGSGATCAVVTVVAILAGKVMAVKHELNQMEGELRPGFEELRTDAREFAKLSSPDEHPDFMIARGYTEAETADGITALEKTEFEDSIPMLREMEAEDMNYKQWVASIVPLGDIIKEGFGLMDIIFLFLGVATAFKIGSGLGQETA